MTRPFARFAALLICLSMLPGCGLLGHQSEKKKRAAAKKAQAEARTRPILIGRVALVDANSRFVLIESASPQNPRVGTTWRAFTDGALVGELRATGVRRRPWVIADIVSGNPSKGDVVFQPPEVESENAPRAEAVQPAPAPAPPKKLPFWKRWFGGKKAVETAQ